MLLIFFLYFINTNNKTNNLYFQNPQNNIIVNIYFYAVNNYFLF